MIMFAVFDKKSETYNLPFFMGHLSEALRAFSDLCQDAQTVLYRHPEDFKLVMLGKFDQKTGRLDQGEELQTLAHADEFRKVAAP